MGNKKQDLRKGKTCIGIEQAPRSQTLKFLRTNLSLEPTSHNPISPTFVPTDASSSCNQKVNIQLKVNIKSKIDENKRDLST